MSNHPWNKTSIPLTHTLKIMACSWLTKFWKYLASKVGFGKLSHGSLPIFVNKIVLEHCHTHLFMYWWWLHSCYNGWVESLWQRPYGLQSLRDLQQTFVHLSSNRFLFSQPVRETLHQWLFHWPGTVLEPLPFIFQNRAEQSRTLTLGIDVFWEHIILGANQIPWLLKVIMVMTVRIECLFCV